ncbi:MAG: HEAT repeat domain-containing protein [Acidimicrobiales bacterium]
METPVPSEVQGLVDRALEIDDEDDDRYWDLVHELHRLGDRQTFQTTADLCRESSASRRRLGLNVLAQLGYESGRPFLEDSLPIVIGLCGRGEPDAVLVAAAAALGHLHDHRGLEALLGLANHHNSDVRWMVATSLSNCAGDPPNTRALDALITLTSDENSDVRDWATFGLGAQLDVDDEHIREALLARLDDPDGDTAGEAIFGLAARNDPRVIEEISHRLGQPDVGNLIVEVAAKMGDSRFLPFLRTLKGQGWDRTDPRGDWLDKAITACLEGPQWRA